MDELEALIRKTTSPYVAALLRFRATSTQQICSEEEQFAASLPTEHDERAYRELMQQCDSHTFEQRKMAFKQAKYKLPDAIANLENQNDKIEPAGDELENLERQFLQVFEKKMTTWFNKRKLKKKRKKKSDDAVPPSIRNEVTILCKDEKTCLFWKWTKRYRLLPRSDFDLSCGEDVHRRIVEGHIMRYNVNTGYGALNVEFIEYVCNPTLMKNFQKMKITLAHRHNFLAESEKPLLFWHGTSQVGVEGIIKNNFKMSHVGIATSDMGWFGKGFYFSENPNVCAGYCDDGWMLLCVVLLGKACKVQMQTGRGLEQGYDSHISADGSEIVIFNPNCILPCYIVKCVPSYSKSKWEKLGGYLYRKLGIGRIFAQFNM